MFTLPESAARDLAFPDGIRLNASSGNWSTTGWIKLSVPDRILFQPVVTIKAVTDICTVSLRSCANQTSGLPKGCSCIASSDEDFQVFVSGDASVPREDIKVTAFIPAQAKSEPLSLSSPIGTIPDLHRNQVSQETLKAITKNFSAEISRLTRQKEDLTTQNDRLATKNSDLKTKMNPLKTQNSDLTTKNTQLSEEKNKLSLENSALLKKIYDLKPPHPCYDVKSSTQYPVVTSASGTQVVCDTHTDNGGWIVFQRRTSNTDFYLDWQQYRDGFGEKPDNFWLGLETIHQLTQTGNFQLRIDMQFNGQKYFTQYDNFVVDSETDNYKLHLGGYTGNTGDSLSYYSNNAEFTTYDRDHDRWSDVNCAESRHGAWWYGSCGWSNLNGMWGDARGYGLYWADLTGYKDSVTRSEMKMRVKRP